MTNGNEDRPELPSDSSEQPAIDHARLAEPVASPDLLPFGGKSLGPLVELATKAAVALSVLCYGAGFIVAVAYYARLGVAAHAISAETYLGAGLSFMVITGIAIASGISLRRSPLWRTRGRQRLLFVALEGVIFASACSSTLLFTGFHWRAPVYCALGGAYVATIGWARFLTFTGDPLSSHNAIVLVQRVSIALVAMVLYSIWVFPYVERRYGGAKPLLIAIGEVGPKESYEGQSVLALAHCSREPSPPKACRRVYLAHESDAYLYMITEHQKGRCAAEQPFVEQVPTFVGREGCVIRLAQSAVSRLELPRRKWAPY